MVTEALPPSFNGAATSLSRIVADDCCSFMSPPASMGPRHRCRGSETITALSASATRTAFASMGPRHRCRGSATPFDCVRSQIRASMGPRHRCRGSSWRRSREARRRPSFNGAATSLSRIGYKRRHNGTHRNRASMGPRHRCRGSRKPRSFRTRRLDWLQWGRDIAVADRELKEHKRALLAELQWGRDIAVADRKQS